MKARSPVSAFAFSLVLSLGLGSSHSYAAPVQWSDNGHWYEAVVRAVAWQDAHALASASVWMGMTGHLATITSSDENLFISGLGSNIAGYHLGGLQDLAATTTSAGWQWVTGEAFSYTNWGPGEPNDIEGFEELGGGNEDRLQLFGVSNADGVTWNDFPGGFEAGYVVEFEAAAAIPEPETYALLLAGLGLLGFAARRRK